MSAPSPAPLSADKYLEALGYRRTIYGINDESPISQERLTELTEKVLRVTPSGFNSQTTRIHLVLGEEQKKLWDAIVEVVAPVMIKGMGEEMYTKAFAPRHAGFRGGYGTALFFEDEKSVAEWKVKHASAASVLDQFSEHTSAMHQLNLWTALELEGFGGSLQHYQSVPGVEAAIRKQLGLPADWSLKAQLVFGKKVQPHPESKPKLPIEDLLKVSA